jgi:hypothetical protein
VIAVARNPSTATALRPLLGANAVAVKADLADFDLFPSVAEEISKVGGGKIDVLIKYAISPGVIECNEVLTTD